MYGRTASALMGGVGDGGPRPTGWGGMGVARSYVLHIVEGCVMFVV